ncbi:MAG: hypothetical protein ACKO63_13925 [Nodosilinea sp.]
MTADKLTSGKPTSGKAKPNEAKPGYSVKFAATPADQALLQSVQQAMTERSLPFDELCKLALKQLLASDPATLPLLALLEQQIMALQLQVMQLEQRSTESAAADVAGLRRQIQDLSERVAQLEQQAVSKTLGSEAEAPEVDPLLSRLAPLLEDF